MTNKTHKLSNLMGSTKDESYKTFTGPYQKSISFWQDMEKLGSRPIYNLLQACGFTLQAFWSILCAAGNLLILKPATTAALDACEQLTDAFKAILSAPLTALFYVTKIPTKVISAWFSGVESCNDLSNIGVFERFKESYDSFAYREKKLLFPFNYIKNTSFFSPYPSLPNFFGQVTSVPIVLIYTMLKALQEAFQALVSILNCAVNLIIYQPKHAQENFQNFSIHLTLSLALAVMAPVHATVEAMAFFSRLGSTWVKACQTQTETEHQPTVAP